jgi:hypothetical protein
MVRHSIAVVVAVLVLTGCVLPARSFDDYEGKAVSSAETAISQAQTASLTGITVRRDGLFAPNVSVLLADAETGAVTARDTFASIQPPDDASDALRAELLPLLERTADEIARLRIAARRRDLSAVAQGTGAVDDLTAELERFVTEHGS